jgi:carboxyl-terminal processing protease
MTSLMLDLRGDPGGLINEGVRVASLFLNPGDTVAISRGRSPDHSKVYLAGQSGNWNDLRLLLLVYHGTASSAELLAGALQDHDRAVIVGTPSFGKGVLQTTYPLGDEIALKLTTARWYTPSGRWVQRPRPDVEGALGNRIPALAPRIFHSSAGRPIPDASGILPDLTVRGVFRSDAERSLLAALGEDLSLFRLVLSDYAAEVRRTAPPRSELFRVTDEMRNQVYDRLQQIGLELPRPTFDNASGYVDDQLGYEISRAVFGPAVEVRRRSLSDRQMQAAVRLLRQARTQENLLAVAAAERAQGTIR